MRMARRVTKVTHGLVEDKDLTSRNILGEFFVYGIVEQEEGEGGDEIDASGDADLLVLGQLGKGDGYARRGVQNGIILLKYTTTIMVSPLLILLNPL